MKIEMGNLTNPKNNSPKNEDPEVKLNTSHSEKVEWELIQKAYTVFKWLLGAVIAIPILEWLLGGMLGWGYSEAIRETTRLLGSVITFILGYLFGTSRK